MDIMTPDAHGLITISSNTTLRDFSQGVFRMRSILYGQSVDLIMHEETVTDFMNKKKE